MIYTYFALQLLRITYIHLFLAVRTVASFAFLYGLDLCFELPTLAKYDIICLPQPSRNTHYYYV